MLFNQYFLLFFISNTHIKVNFRKEVLYMQFYNNEHKEFYYKSIECCQMDDSYHRALFYVIGIDNDCRRNIHKLYNFENNQIKLNGLNEAWQTSGSFQCCLLGFNLFNGYVYNHNKIQSTPYGLFTSEYGAFFIEGIKLRYPESTRLRNKDIQVR